MESPQRCPSLDGTAMNKIGSSLALSASLIGGVTSVALAQPSTLQRLEVLERQEREAKVSEEAKWRIFPNSRPARRNFEENQEGSKLPNGLNGWDPLATGGWLMRNWGVNADRFCSYYWSGWKFYPSTGIRTTRRKCGPNPESLLAESMIAVHCATLKISEKPGPAPGWHWQSWKLPTAPDREMVVALCDNLK